MEPISALSEIWQEFGGRNLSSMSWVRNAQVYRSLGVESSYQNFKISLTDSRVRKEDKDTKESYILNRFCIIVYLICDQSNESLMILSSD